MKRVYAFLLLFPLMAAIVIGALVAPAEAQIHGINISGMEYSQGSHPPRPEAIAYYGHKGFNACRIPITIENIQPKVGGPLDPTVAAGLQGTINACIAANMDPLVDIHNYGRRNGAVMTDPKQFYQFMLLMAQTFHGPRVSWGIMNEPHDQDGEAWAAITNAGILAVRLADWNAKVVVGLPDWSSVYAWADPSNAIWSIAALIMDPATGKLFFDVHCYYDQNGAGQTTQVVPGVRDKVAAATAIAQQRGIHFLMTETGFGSDAASLAAGKSVIAYVNANPAVWGGWYYWAGGGWWGSDYVYLLDPVGNAWDASTWAKPVDRPQMGALVP